MLLPISGARLTPEYFQTVGFRLLETDFADELYNLCSNSAWVEVNGVPMLSYKCVSLSQSCVRCVCVRVRLRVRVWVRA